MSKAFDTINDLRNIDTLSSDAQVQLNNKLSLSGGILTGALKEAKVAILNSQIDLSLGNLFTKTISALTTFTVTNISGSNITNSFILELNNPGAFTINWFSGVKWAGGVAPTLTVSGVDILGFYSHDGGTTWRGMVLVKDSK